jgi:putative DNA primase/helicase
LNDGFYEGGKSTLCVGQGANINTKDFKVFCPKMFAGIGKSLPDTVADRSIPITLQRKTRDEAIQRFRRRKAKPGADPLRTELSNWVESILSRLRDAEPQLPDELTDRQQDAAEILLAIADEAGGDWPSAVRNAAVEIWKEVEDKDRGVQILLDIRWIFDELGLGKDKKIFTADLVGYLNQIETSPWPDWNNGKGITATALSKILKPFGVGPGSTRIGESTGKGYTVESFNNAFRRYLPVPSSVSPSPAVTPSQPHTAKDLHDFSNRHTNENVTSKKSNKPFVIKECDGVTDETPFQGSGAENGGVEKPKKFVCECGVGFDTSAGYAKHAVHECSKNS